MKTTQEPLTTTIRMLQTLGTFGVIILCSWSALADATVPAPWSQVASLSDQQRAQIQQIVASHNSSVDKQKANLIAERTKLHQAQGTTNLLKMDIIHWTQQTTRISGLLQRREIMMVLTPQQRVEASELWSKMDRTAEAVDFQAFETKQKNAFWCWAASIAIVLNYGGVPWDQERVAQEIKGTSDAWEKATAAEIEAGLKRVKISPDSKRTWGSGCHYQHGLQDAGRMIFAMEFGRPMLAALENVHVVVIHKIIFREDGNSGQRRIQALIFYDPLQQVSKSMTWDEAQKQLTDAWYPLVSQVGNSRF